MGYKYDIKSDFIKSGTKRRPGTKRVSSRFVVAHDTGNSGSTAAGNVNYYKNSANDQYASAHYFVDDKDIIKCIPRTERAYHVIYDVTTDNAKYGDDANDAAIGVELCYGGKIDMKAAYARYVWLIAYLLKTDKLSADKVAGHFELDPARKVDPVKNGLTAAGKSWSQFKADVKAEYDTLNADGTTKSAPKPTPKPSKPAEVPGKDDHIHRVIVDGKQIGAYGKAENVADEVKKAVAKGAKKIEVNRV